jgi:DNA repair protein RecO
MQKTSEYGGINQGARSASNSGQIGVVWRRSDFRESSRLITLLTPDRGRLTTLGKGAYRPASQCLGRIDFLNLVEVKLSRGNLPVLHRVKVLHEPRRLREPKRYRAASYLSELFDSAFLPTRADPQMFDLLVGGIRLLERCNPRQLTQILLGIELRFLHEQGLLAPLVACRQCGQSMSQKDLYSTSQQPGLLCADHTTDRSNPISARTMEWLDTINQSPGRAWPSLPPPPRPAIGLLGHWISNAMERQPASRQAAYRN